MREEIRTDGPFRGQSVRVVEIERGVIMGGVVITVELRGGRRVPYFVEDVGPLDAISALAELGA